MNKVERVKVELEKLTNLELPKGTMSIDDARELISSTKEGKEVIQTLKKMDIDSDWLGHHGFIIASMLLNI